MKASLCIIAYKRAEMLDECIQSLHDNTEYPFELIVNVDGNSGYHVDKVIDKYRVRSLISKAILVNGGNRGVGHSFTNCVKLSEGEYIFKIDTDILFNKGWLSECIKLLHNPSISAVSPFNYNNYDPDDNRFQILHSIDGGYIVNDFVSSIYGFRKVHWKNREIPDDGFHQTLRTEFGSLAITKKDFVVNQGFGLEKSVYVVNTEKGPAKAMTYDEPLIFNK